MSKRSIFNPVEQRVYGLVYIAQGLVMLVVGKHAPSWSLQYAIRGAQRKARKAADRL